MKKILLIAAIAAFFMLPFFSAAAYAAPDDIVEDTIIIEEQLLPDDAPPAPAIELPTEQPFTPSGTGTVIDTATDADRKVFYTITTPDEHVFYLVIDKQRGQENVYFLNAVTVADLMALAEIPDIPQAGTVTAPLPTVTPEMVDTSTPEPEPEQNSGNLGTLIFIAAIVILGGGAGWYFKIYRPKQQGMGSREEYEPFLNEAEIDCPDNWDDEEDEDDSPPWDVDDEDGGE